jgi:hypothetical protein
MAKIILYSSEVESLGEFKWRDKFGNALSLKDMTTQHLFFSLRMLWNHNTPEEWRIYPYTVYNLSNMERSYVNEAVIALLAELEKREDLTPYFKKCMRIMYERIEQYQGILLLEHGG